MKLTAEQQEQVRAAKERGDRRVFLTFTPDQRSAWQKAVEEELAGKSENIAHFRKIQSAAEQPGFFGDIRRAMLLSRLPIDALASAIGVSAELLSDFRAGDAELPATALDQLIQRLGLRLMQEIPR